MSESHWKYALTGLLAERYISYRVTKKTDMRQRMGFSPLLHGVTFANMTLLTLGDFNEASTNLYSVVINE